MRILILLAVNLATGDSADNVPFSNLSSGFAEMMKPFINKQTQTPFLTLIPVAYTNTTMDVALDINLVSVNSFDEIGGYLEISGYLDLKWTFYAANPSKDDVFALYNSDSIWKPPLLLLNSIKSTSEIGDSTSKIRCNLKSLDCEWKPWVVLRGVCTPDVRFYPFDTQTCSYKIAAWGYLESELALTPTRSDWKMELFEVNAEWTVQLTTSNSYSQNDVSFVEFTIQLKRIPTYYIINLIAPVVLMCLLNACVFILPVESGERVGFSITCFLSFAVLLNIIMSFIPSSSANLAHLCYFTFIMMVFSCGMSLATVFTLWVHFKPENSRVPVVLRGFMYVLKCRCFHYTPPQRNDRSSKVRIMTVDSERDDDSNDKTEHEYTKHGDQDNDSLTVTWKEVASLLDIFFLLGFLVGQIFYSVGYLLPIILN